MLWGLGDFCPNRNIFLLLVILQFSFGLTRFRLQDPTWLCVKNSVVHKVREAHPQSLAELAFRKGAFSSSLDLLHGGSTWDFNHGLYSWWDVKEAADFKTTFQAFNMKVIWLIFSLSLSFSYMELFWMLVSICCILLCIYITMFIYDISISVRTKNIHSSISPGD